MNKMHRVLPLMATFSCLFVRVCVLDAADAEDKVRCLTFYLAELTLLERAAYAQYLPSVIAASCVVVALHTCGAVCWVRWLSMNEYTWMESCPPPYHHPRILTCSVRDIP